uniref:Uncharacterized protein n=1 Tax=Varanus komodoensis TaxID=61221 RepID=A0A8D2ITV5_VARKO
GEKDTVISLCHFQALEPFLHLKQAMEMVAKNRKGQFLVLLPVQMQTESHQKICIHLNHVNESVVLSSFLEYGNENKSLIRDIVTDKDMFQCIQFQLPRWEPSWGSPKVFATVQVIGATVRFWSRKMVLIKNRSNLIFLQTDKPLYKPGERGMWDSVLWG